MVGQSRSDFMAAMQSEGNDWRVLVVLFGALATPWTGKQVGVAPPRRVAVKLGKVDDDGMDKCSFPGMGLVAT